MTKVFHKECGGLAFIYTHPQVQGAPILANRALLSGGDHPVAGTQIVCQACGNPMQDVILESL